MGSWRQYARGRVFGQPAGRNLRAGAADCAPNWREGVTGAAGEPPRQHVFARRAILGPGCAALAAVWRAAALGAVQGLTEFLPVSSSGHLVLAERVLGVARPGLALEAGLHLGTLAAVVFAYRRDLWRGAAAWWPQLLVATAPAAAAGLALGPLLERLFGSVPAVGAALAATGVLLLASGRLRPGRRRIGDLRLGEAFRVGLLQALALAPGLSRSGATIVGGLLLGLEPAEAARFSFLLSLPAVGGAVALHARGLRAGAGAGTIWLGAAVAALVGCWAIGACVARLRRGGLGPFGWYCLVVGTLCVLRGAVSGEWR